MRQPFLALLLISLPASAYAQVQPGDLLLNSIQNPDVLVHYRPDGTVVQTSGGGTGSLWEGAAILPNGNWVTTRRNPKNGVNIFDGVTGAEIATWDLPPGFNSVAGDLGVGRSGQGDEQQGEERLTHGGLRLLTRKGSPSPYPWPVGPQGD